MDRIAFAKGCATSSSIALREAVWGGLTRARCASPNGVPGGQRSHGGSRRGRAGSCSRRGLLRSPRPNKPLQLTGCPAAFEQALISTPWPGSPACGPLPSSRPRALRRARHRKPRCARLATPALLRPVASFQARALASGPQLNGVVLGLPGFNPSVRVFAGRVLDLVHERSPTGLPVWSQQQCCVQFKPPLHSRCRSILAGAEVSL